MVKQQAIIAAEAVAAQAEKDQKVFKSQSLLTMLIASEASSFRAIE